MRKFTLILITSFICFSAFKSIAQTGVGYVHIKIYNAKSPLCKIDDSLGFRVNDFCVALSPGKHNIKIWMPLTSLIDTSLFVKINDTIHSVFKVKYTTAYSHYLADYANYRRTKKIRWFISPIFIGTAIGGGIIANKKAADYVEKALRNREEYSAAPAQSTLDGCEASFIENKKNYKKFVKVEIGMYTLAGLLTANYIRLLIKQHHTVPPIYKEERLLSRISINAYPDLATKKWLLGLSMNF